MNINNKVFIGLVDDTIECVSKDRIKVVEHLTKGVPVEYYHTLAIEGVVHIGNHEVRVALHELI